MATDYQGLARELITRAKKHGAKQAEAYLEVGRESSVRVRDGKIEDLTQATSKGAGLRVFVNDRLGFAWTSDFTKDALEATAARAVALAAASAPNKHNGLPGKKDVAGVTDVGALYDPAIASLDPEWKLRAALEMEKLGKSLDPRIKTFEGVGAGDTVSEVHLASSEGARGSYQQSSAYLYASAVAAEGQQLQVGDWYDVKLFFADLDSPESVVKKAVERAVRMLGATKVKTRAVPVIFEPSIAAGFVASLASAADGDAVFKKSSFLAGKLGQKIGAANVTLVDDGRLPRGLGTAPFDGEGVPTRRTPIVERGVLSSFLYDAFTARKAKTTTTGNAARGYSSMPSIGTHNLYLEKGDADPSELIRQVKDGFYVTKMLGHGLDVVTGDYSRGANGLWITNGELGAPVQEVTVAGTLLGMLERIDGIGSDLTFRGSTGAPTIRFAELTVSGSN